MRYDIVKVPGMHQWVIHDVIARDEQTPYVFCGRFNHEDAARRVCGLLNAAESDYTRMSKRVEQLIDEVNERDNLVYGQKGKIEQQEARIAQLIKMVDASDDKCAYQERLLSNANVKIEALATLADNNEEEADTLIDQVDSLKSINNRLRGKIKEHNEYKTKTIAEMDKLIHQLQCVRGINDRLTGDYELAKKNHRIAESASFNLGQRLAEVDNALSKKTYQVQLQAEKHRELDRQIDNLEDGLQYQKQKNQELLEDTACMKRGYDNQIEYLETQLEGANGTNDDLLIDVQTLQDDAEDNKDENDELKEEIDILERYNTELNDLVDEKNEIIQTMAFENRDQENQIQELQDWGTLGKKKEVSDLADRVFAQAATLREIHRLSGD